MRIDEQSLYCYLPGALVRRMLGDTSVLDVVMSHLEVPRDEAQGPSRSAAEKEGAIERRITELQQSEGSLWYGVEAPEIFVASVFRAASAKTVALYFNRVQHEKSLLLPVAAWLRHEKELGAHSGVDMGSMQIDVLGYCKAARASRPSSPPSRSPSPSERPSWPPDRPSWPSDRPSSPSERPSLPSDRPSSPSERSSSLSERPSSPPKRASSPPARPTWPPGRASWPPERPSSPPGPPSGAGGLQRSDVLLSVGLTNNARLLERDLARIAAFGEYTHRVHVACTPYMAAEYLNKHASSGESPRWNPSALNEKVKALGLGLLIVRMLSSQEAEVDEVVEPETRAPESRKLKDIIQVLESRAS